MIVGTITDPQAEPALGAGRSDGRFAAAMLDQVRMAEAPGAKALLIRSALDQLGASAPTPALHGFYGRLGGLRIAIAEAALPEGARAALLDGLASLLKALAEASDRGSDLRRPAIGGLGAIMSALDASVPEGGAKTQVSNSLAALLMEAAKGTPFGAAAAA